MRKIVVSALVVPTMLGILAVTLAGAVDPVTAARHKAELQRLKAEQQRRIAGMKMSGTPAHRGLPPAHSQPAGPAKDFRGNPVGASATKDFRGNSASASGDVSSAPPFNASSAPPPAEALKSFVAVAKNASSMDQLLRYLPASKQKTLKERQSSYDPRKAAADSQYFRQRNPDMKKESIERLTNSPFTNELNHLKGLAGEILDVLSVKVEGNKARITVSTTNGGTVNGQEYEYGKADIELVGEGNDWKFLSYNDSFWIYKDRPVAPPAR
jgi:hypothetical protein